MNRTLCCAFVFAFVVSAAAAQPPGAPGSPGARGRGEAPGQYGGDRTLDFLAGGMPLGAVVTGAPYSGEGITTVTQTLGDGTRIERTVKARFYRDSEGRTRREQTILGLGALGESQSITIVDPVAGIMYALDPATHRGRRSPMPTPRGGADLDRLRALGREPERRVAPGSEAGIAPPPPPPPPPPGARRGGPPPGVPNAPEPLGTKQIAGIAAVGTKRSETIPAGTIGNDRPIEVTDERWESPELKVLVLSKHHDPRTGDVEYRLTNVNRSDPPRELFAPSPDYTITDAPPPPPPAPRGD
jgi:hypothetical protein